MSAKKPASERAKHVNVTLPRSYFRFLQDNGLSPTAVIQMTIEDLARKAGVDLDAVSEMRQPGSTHNQEPLTTR